MALVEELTKLDRYTGTTQYLVINGISQYPTDMEKQQDPTITPRKKVLREVQNALRKIGYQPGTPLEQIKANGVRLDEQWFEGHFAQLFRFNDKTHVSSSIVVKLMEPIDVAAVGTFNPSGTLLGDGSLT